MTRSDLRGRDTPGRRAAALGAAVLVGLLAVGSGPAVPNASAAGVGSDERPAPTDSATARAEAAALRLRLATLRDRVDAAVRRYADAVAALDGAATAEVLAGQQLDTLERQQADARARAGAAARALYMAGGPGGLYAEVLSQGSLTAVLDSLTSIHGLLTGALLADRAADGLAAQAAGARAQAERRALTATERVRLAGQARAAAQEAQRLQTELTAQLAAADATVRRLVAEEEEARRAAQARRAAEQAARQAALRSLAGTVGKPGAGPSTVALAPLELVGVLRRAGFTAEGLRTAWAIAMRESGGQPGAVGGLNGNGTRDYGLFQINDVHLGRLIAPADVFDAAANADAAFRLSRAGTDWSHWGLGDQGWAGHLMRDIPAVYAELQARFQYWYDRFPA